MRDARDGRTSPNEHIAQFLERTWPNRFSELCCALRRYPLPVTSGAAATVLRGSSVEAVRAVDAYCRGAQRRDAPYDCGGGDEANLFPPPSEASASCGEPAAILFSPFRCFKLRRLDAGDLPPPGDEGRGGRHRAETFDEDTTTTTAEGKLGVKELRAKCASRGLLTSGTKGVLLARLRQYDALQQSGPLVEPAKVGEKKQTTNTQEIGTTSPLRFGLTQEEQLEHSQRLRTPFLSPSVSRQPSPLPANPPHHPQRRLVGTPQEFVTALTQQRKRRENRGDTLSKSLALENRTSRWQWRILVDNRERIQGAHDRMVEAFTAAGVPTLSCTLSCGDFMIEVFVPDNISGGAGIIGPEEPARGNLDDVQASSAVGSTSSLRRVFSVVVERKTVKDLCASIASSRYYEQRQLMTLLPFESVVWVVEGTTELLRPDEQRRVLSACASLAALPRFRVVRTRHLKETILYLHQLGVAYAGALAGAEEEGREPPRMTNTADCMTLTARVRRELRARTTFPRMLMCVRGCSSALATQLACKYGSLLQLWKRLRDCGREACDADVDIRRLSNAQKDVYVRLTEFLLTEDYC